MFTARGWRSCSSKCCVIPAQPGSDAGGRGSVPVPSLPGCEAQTRPPNWSGWLFSISKVPWTASFQLNTPATAECNSQEAFGIDLKAQRSSGLGCLDLKTTPALHSLGALSKSVSCFPPVWKGLLTKMKWKWQLLSRVRLFETPWTIQCMEFSRPEHWSG